MKILFCNLFEALTSKTIERYLRDSGVNCLSKTYYTPEDLYEDDRIEKMIAKDVKLGRPDAVMTINFWPPVARVCKRNNVKYIAYAYDSPLNIPDERDMEYETNFIFLFDRAETEKFRGLGIDRVYHAPLATDVRKWDSFSDGGDTPYDITLIGKLYESTYPGISAGMDEYHKGFFKGVIAAQQQIYGYYLVEEVISGKMDSLNECLRSKDKEANVSLAQMSYSMGSYINYLDRVSLLRLLQQAGQVHLFTGNLSEQDRGLLKGVEIHGSVDYETEMPGVFKASKINLNPTSRVIRSGVPQRALDVLGCKGFLLSSFQSELCEYFVPEEEVAVYESYEDAVSKAQFYLRNDSLREQMIERSYLKIKEFFSYETRLGEMLETAGLQG